MAKFRMYRATHTDPRSFIVSAIHITPGDIVAPGDVIYSVKELVNQLDEKRNTYIITNDEDESISIDEVFINRGGLIKLGDVLYDYDYSNINKEKTVNDQSLLYDIFSFIMSLFVFIFLWGFVLVVIWDFDRSSGLNFSDNVISYIDDINAGMSISSKLVYIIASGLSLFICMKIFEYFISANFVNYVLSMGVFLSAILFGFLFYMDNFAGKIAPNLVEEIPHVRFTYDTIARVTEAAGLQQKATPEAQAEFDKLVEELW